MDVLTNTTEVTSNFSGEQTVDSSTSTEQHVLNVLNSVIGFLAIIGNVFVLVVIFTNRKSFQSLIHLLILHQSLIDFTSSLVFTLLRLDRWQPLLAVEGSVGEIFCRIWYFEYPLWALFMTSTLNLVLLSTERYMAVVYPVMHLNKLTRNKTKLAMVLIWFIGFGYQSYLAATNTNIEGACVWGWKPGIENLQTFFGILTFFLEYFCPLCIISVEYVFIALKLRNLDKTRANRRETLAMGDGASATATSAAAASTTRVDDRNNNHGGTASTAATNGKRENQFSRAFRNVIKTLLLVFLVNIICWTPTEFEYMIYNLGGDIDFEGTFHKMSVVLVLCNIVCNPFIYAMQYKEFQKGFKKTFCAQLLGIELRGNRVESTVATVVSNR